MTHQATGHRQLEDEPRLRRGRAPRSTDRRAVEEPAVGTHRDRGRAALRGPAQRRVRSWTPSGSRVAVGAQHVNAHENGAHTGEVSASMLHAPRRHLGPRRTLRATRDVRHGRRGRRARRCAPSCARASRPCSAWARRSRYARTGDQDEWVRASTAQRPRRPGRAIRRAGHGRLRADLGDRDRPHGRRRTGALDDDPRPFGPGDVEAARRPRSSTAAR